MSILEKLLEKQASKLQKKAAQPYSLPSFQYPTTQDRALYGMSAPYVKQKIADDVLVPNAECTMLNPSTNLSAGPKDTYLEDARRINFAKAYPNLQYQYHYGPFNRTDTIRDMYRMGTSLEDMKKVTNIGDFIYGANPPVSTPAQKPQNGGDSVVDATKPVFGQILRRLIRRR